jgi:ABC-type branched-subunit amino acid transport system substrate-binding protein
LVFDLRHKKGASCERAARELKKNKKKKKASCISDDDEDEKAYYDEIMERCQYENPNVTLQEMAALGVYDQGDEDDYRNERQYYFH